MKQYIQDHRKILGTIAALCALAIATVYFFVVPEIPDGTPFVMTIILRYAHSICWLFLAAVCVLWATKRPSGQTASLAYTALITYAIFMGTFIFTSI